jgi:CheY-like chemotaxis protein
MLVEARRKGLSLSGSIDPILDKSNVYADDQRIRQVLLNLISNAIKFTSSGRITIEATCLSQSADTILVRFSVRDSGPGIPAASIPDLFKRFSQLDASRERKFGGSGLGLAICKHIVEANNGTIGVDSEIGVGSTFWFELPLPVVDASPAQKPSSAPMILLSKQHRILVVDDIEPNRRLTATVLKTQGYHVTTAASGQEAITRVTSENYDLILMDVQMPGMSGLTATKIIKELGGKAASIPIIGMTANVFPDDIAKCRAAGMSAHLGKPFELDELIRCVAAALACDDISEPRGADAIFPSQAPAADLPYATEKIA